MDKEARTSLLHKYLKPENCCLDAPLVNPELCLTLGKSQLSRDDYYATLQSRLDIGLAFLGKTMTDIISQENFATLKDVLLPGLSDTARILLDLFYGMSIQRRSLFTPLLSKSLKEVVKKKDPSKLLFGPDLGERLKVLQNLEKTPKNVLPVTTFQNTSVFHNRQRLPLILYTGEARQVLQGGHIKPRTQPNKGS